MTQVPGVALLGALAMLGSMAVPAMADAPIPIPGTTKVDSIITNSDGSHTVTLEGQWTWATHLKCPTSRDGVGYQVDWFDGNSANPIGSENSPIGVLYVGDSVDNIVHSIDTLGGSNSPTSGNAFFDGVPSSYLTHNTTNSTPTSTDADGWVSNCNNMDPSTQISSGTWGPISHVYAPEVAAFTVCPVMYDPHGDGTSNGGVIGSSSVKEITAGGTGHNSDNSYEGNGDANQCLQSTFAIPPPSSSSPPSSPPPPTPEPAPTTTTAATTTTTTTTTAEAVTKTTTTKRAVVRVPPLLRWTPVRGASYYNFQLYRGGKKILSVWPRKASLQLKSSWRFHGRRYRLSPGRYRWYVWPGFGPLAARRYGPAIGRHTLVIRR
jgi:hypothetical protein